MGKIPIHKFENILLFDVKYVFFPIWITSINVYLLALTKRNICTNIALLEGVCGDRWLTHGHRELLDGRLCRPDFEPLVSNFTTVRPR